MKKPKSIKKKFKRLLDFLQSEQISPMEFSYMARSIIESLMPGCAEETERVLRAGLATLAVEDEKQHATAGKN